MRTRFKRLVYGIGLVGSVAYGHAHDGIHASVHDTVAGIIERLRSSRPAKELVELTVPQIEALLTPAEREVLANEHVRFKVNIPVVVTVVRDTSLGSEPFWLAERGFKTNGIIVSLQRERFDVWEKAFPAGEIGLGVHSFTVRGVHYLALVRPQSAGAGLNVTGLYPAHLRTAPFVAGVEPFVDQPLVLKTVPTELEGQLLIRMDANRDEDARLVSVFKQTEFPAGNSPDQVVLTWSDDPRKTQTIQWRTSTNAAQTFIRIAPRGSEHNPKVMRAKSEALTTPTLVNDARVLRHTAKVKGLKPGTAYTYSVGDGSNWTPPAEFTTGPAGPEPFAFVYMGDAQNGLDKWGKLLKTAYEARPDAAFYLMAGDLVNRGAERWDWDAFFEDSRGVFDRRTLVPAIGNHECQGGMPGLYLAQFTLPRNGPRHVTAERAYAFEYSNAKFIILDSNLDPASQTGWLKQQLRKTKATWKFVAYHHPAYSSGGNRDNEKVRTLWTPIFDKYHVDLALQGHDHAYLRTYPMKHQQRAATSKDGTVYIISVSGTKFYDQAGHDYTEVGFTKVATYQVLDIQVQGNRLVYRAHDIDGQVRDELVIEK